MEAPTTYLGASIKYQLLLKTLVAKTKTLEEMIERCGDNADGAFIILFFMFTEKMHLLSYERI